MRFVRFECYRIRVLGVIIIGVIILDIVTTSKMLIRILQRVHRSFSSCGLLLLPRIIIIIIIIIIIPVTKGSRGRRGRSIRIVELVGRMLIIRIIIIIPKEIPPRRTE